MVKEFNGVSFDEISQGILKVVGKALEEDKKELKLNMTDFSFSGGEDNIRISCFIKTK